MLVGVIADSHDNVPAIIKAVEFFNEKKVGFVIHAGDFIAPFTLKPLEELRCPWIGVFGNNDGEQKGLTQMSKGRIQPAPYELNLDGKKVVVVHDLDLFNLDELAQRGAQVLIYGHTHDPEIEKNSNGLLLVNPGELGGWLRGKKTLALLDTEKLEATLEDLPSDQTD
jgi:uncharacterized protein